MMTTRAARFSIPPVDEVYYPESDGKPMAESDIHIEQIMTLREALQEHFRDQQDVYVSGNIFVYYVQGDPSAVISPDLLLVRGVEKRLRSVYKVWEEGKAPDFVLEVTSRTTRAEDTFGKFHVYQEVLHVPEYFQFDPTGDYLDPQLRGYRLTGDTYQITEGDLKLRSAVLGLDLIVEDGKLRLYDPATGIRLRTYHEAENALRLEAEARANAEAEVERLRAKLNEIRSED